MKCLKLIARWFPNPHISNFLGGFTPWPPQGLDPKRGLRQPPVPPAEQK